MRFLLASKTRYQTKGSVCRLELCARNGIHAAIKFMLAQIETNSKVFQVHNVVDNQTVAGLKFPFQYSTSQ